MLYLTTCVLFKIRSLRGFQTSSIHLEQMASVFQILVEHFVATSRYAESIAVATLAQLALSGDVKESLVTEAINKYRIFDVTAADAGNTEGSG